MQKSCVEVLERFADHLRTKGKSELTVKTYVKALELFDKYLEESDGNLCELTRHDVQSYINYLREHASPTTIQTRFAAISVFARFLGRRDVVEDIRLPEVRKTRNIAPKSLERTERNRLLRQVERGGNLRDIAIVYMLLFTGLRVSELCALNRDDVEIGERSGKVIVRRGKGDVARVVPLSAEVRHHLRRYLATREDDNPALFLSNFRKRISVRTVQHMLSKYGVHPHELRHTFCRELVASGVDIATVAELAGHADVNTTRRYAKPTPNELEAAIERAFS